MAISALGTSNPAVLVIQTFYIGISLLGITRIFVLSHMLRQTPEERAFVRTHLPDLKPVHVRPLLSRGRWMELEVGHVLATQGVPIPYLYYLADGNAKVWVDDHEVGTCRDCFVGELTALSGAPATSTVIADGPCRVLAFDAVALRKLLNRKPDIKLALIAGFGQATKALLLMRNREAKQSKHAAQ